MFDYATAAVESALAAGASYADARVVSTRTEAIEVLNQQLQSVDRAETIGVGVRALIGSSWGFYATAELTDAAARAAGMRAAAVAKASALVSGPPLDLADVPVTEAFWETPHIEHWADVSLSEKVDMLVGITGTMQGVAGIALARGNLGFFDTLKWFVSSQGHRIHQHIVESGGGYDATALGQQETQRRSYPQSFGQFATGGYETIRAWDYPGNAQRIAEEAAQLLTAGTCPEGEKTLILEGSQLALQIHESVGHAIELDRILGWEAAFAGTSHLELPKLGTHRYGSEVMQITADATIPGSLGTFGYDDEGTPAGCVDIVKDGVWVGVLSGRDSAAVAGLPPGGMVRADGYNRLPMVRMTNVGLLPGDSSLEEIISETEDGVYMATNRSWSIDDRRLNFQFGTEIGWEVKNGKLGKMVKNPTYTGITPQFWGQLDMLAGVGERVAWGTPNCGKGQPMQIGHTGHPASPGRFKSVRVGVKG
ncbi:MAG: TldD/PmbA family protein [Actinobacteria bacterium]|nr:TldD/PmbA family protein [Actinomycetota bacterium]MBU1492509.1 TldD/PmbA family protein [Actinomycetota bacterium]